MSDQHNKQPPKGWMRASASPMRANASRLMSPTPNSVPRQRSPTPTFNARSLADASTFNPNQQQSPHPPLRRLPPTPTGFTTVYDSQRFSPAHPPPPLYQQPKPTTSFNQPKVPMSPLNFPSDASVAKPFRNTFSPTPSAPTPSSIPPFSPPPTPQYMYMDNDRQMKTVNDFYVVPLEPANLSKDISVYEQDEARPSTADIIAQQSQDYVDEKLAEYQATISLLQALIASKVKVLLLFMFCVGGNVDCGVFARLKCKQKELREFKL
ncbi:CLUMA_CG012050, isoform A [Clunio marinus]|uniref:CLUMA_CG012050, isoform A n=1 Tax=Clunio marinus TaxID=568069 RepID=A0A1J1IF10_9DIPT|nr:CLUMA_CG012050, isoform A [Clunio marinus]